GYLKIECVEADIQQGHKLEPDRNYRFVVTLRRTPTSEYTGPRCLLNDWGTLPVTLQIDLTGGTLVSTPQSLPSDNRRQVSWAFTVRPADADEIMNLTLTVLDENEQPFIERHHEQLQINHTTIVEPKPTSVIVNLIGSNSEYHVDNKPYPFRQPRPNDFQLKNRQQNLVYSLAKGQSIALEVSEMVSSLMEDAWWHDVHPETNMLLIDRDYHVPWELALIGSDRLWGAHYCIGHMAAHPVKKAPVRHTEAIVLFGDESRDMKLYNDMLENALYDVTLKNAARYARVKLIQQSVTMLEDIRRRAEVRWLHVVGAVRNGTVSCRMLEGVEIPLDFNRSLKMRGRPIVCLDIARDPGQHPHDLSKLAYSLLERGAGAVICPIHSLPSEIMGQFFDVFYRVLLTEERISLGCAVRMTREYLIDERRDEMSGAFVLFGNPQYVVSIGSAGQ
ncbi:MAG: hypothetical protein AAF787_16190, partial [Chloroflexota bacterium]